MRASSLKSGPALHTFQRKSDHQCVMLAGCAGEAPRKTIAPVHYTGLSDGEAGAALLAVRIECAAVIDSRCTQV